MTIYIHAAYRTVLGSFKGALKDMSSIQLGGIVMAAAAEGRPHPSQVLMGQVLQAGVGQAPARKAALLAGLPDHIPCQTLNKVCGSGLQAIIDGVVLLEGRHAQSVIVGGMESMTLAPHMLPNARMNLDPSQITPLDHMIYDGLTDTTGTEAVTMGVFAEATAQAHNLSRDALDAWALGSLQKVQKAWDTNAWAGEVISVADLRVDEHILKVDPEKIPRLRSAFAPHGVLTAASSSPLADGACALYLSQEADAGALAKIVGWAMHSQSPKDFTIAPLGAITKLLHKVGWAVTDVDAFEINEAFASVPLMAIHALNIDPHRINRHGGACGMGHPLGVSGARIVGGLAHILKKYHLQRGVASLCIGGGEALAIALEAV